MILAIDVHYKESYAKVVGVKFNWEDVKPKEIITIKVNNILPYESGKFYKRELPCIIQVLEKVNLDEIELIIIDGHIFIDNDNNYGLGGYLWEKLNKKIPIIGVAKKSFYNTEQVSHPILRGNSKNPLFVSSVGIDLDFAKNKIQNMKGEYRIPTLLKFLDKLTKEK